jgi:RND family efflux transporter MFP subunit
MTSNWRQNGLMAGVVLLAGIGLSYLLLMGKPKPETQAVPPAPAVRVEVVAARPQSRSLLVETQGTVRPQREINLVSRVAGRVESVANAFAAGGFFLADVPLLKIEDADYQFAIARAKSQVAAARQRVAEERGRAMQAKREWRDLGSDEANALFLREPQLASAEAALLAAEADLGAAQLDLERSAVSVPFNGRVSEKYVDVGQYVSPGTAIAKVYATDMAEIRLPLTDRQVGLLDLPLNYDNSDGEARQGSVVTLRTRFANKAWEWQGRIVRTEANIDLNSRVVYAVAAVDRPFARVPGSERPPLSPGMFVSAIINGRSFDAVSEIPRSALRNDGAVMIADANDRAHLQPVTMLQSSAELAWVQGLARGDRVIVTESRQTLAGMVVAVQPSASIAERSR